MLNILVQSDQDVPALICYGMCPANDEDMTAENPSHLSTSVQVSSGGKCSKKDGVFSFDYIGGSPEVNRTVKLSTAAVTVRSYFFLAVVAALAMRQQYLTNKFFLIKGKSLLD